MAYLAWETPLTAGGRVGALESREKLKRRKITVVEGELEDDGIEDGSDFMASQLPEPHPRPDIPPSGHVMKKVSLWEDRASSSSNPRHTNPTTVREKMKPRAIKVNHHFSNTYLLIL